jgi:hypothetical protein
VPRLPPEEAIFSSQKRGSQKTVSQKSAVSKRRKVPFDVVLEEFERRRGG